MNWIIKGKGTVKSQKELRETLLAVRNIISYEEFINPQDPYLFLKDSKQIFGKFFYGLEGIYKLIREALEKGSWIYIHGDYDVDGISATAILWDLIYNFLGYKNCVPFIPDRFEHGYGLTEKSIRAVGDIRSVRDVEEGKNPLLITLDCGITAVDEVAYAKKKGFKVVIIDHHELPKKLPKADSILHSYNLCSGGIAYLFSSYVKKKSDKKNLDLGALSTVVDLQPLTGINRSIVKHGFPFLTKSERLGIVALKDLAGIKDKEIGSFEVGWIIGPRLNASGRMASGMDSLRLLCTSNKTQAKEIAEKLNSVNLERQQATENIFAEAFSAVGEVDLGKIIIVKGENYHEGVIGLVAQKLVAKFFRPSIVISVKDGVSKASARSVPGFNITSFLRNLESLLESVGGHKMASGFSIKTEKIDSFIKKANALAKKEIDSKLLEPFLEADCELDFSLIEKKLLKEIEQFEPFGLGNPSPIFVTRDLVVDDKKIFGKDSNHISMLLRKKMGFPAVRAKIFGSSVNLLTNLKNGSKVDVAFSLSKNSYNGNENLEMIIKDIFILS